MMIFFLKSNQSIHLPGTGRCGRFFLLLLGTHIKGKSSDVFVLLGEPVDVAHSMGQFVTLAQNQICIDDLTGTDVM